MLTDGHTDVHEANRLFARLCERACNESQMCVQNIVPKSYDIRDNIKPK
jgi:hypothetical protein